MISEKNKYVLLAADGRTIVIDPTTQKPAFWTSKTTAEIFAKGYEKDTGVRYYVRTLEEAICVVAKQTMGIDIKPPFNSGTEVYKKVIAKLL